MKVTLIEVLYPNILNEAEVLAVTNEAIQRLFRSKGVDLGIAWNVSILRSLDLKRQDI